MSVEKSSKNGLAITVTPSLLLKKWNTEHAEIR